MTHLGCEEIPGPLGHLVASSTQLYWGTGSGSVSLRGTHHPALWSSTGIWGVKLEKGNMEIGFWNHFKERKDRHFGFEFGTGLEHQGIRNSTGATGARRGHYTCTWMDNHSIVQSVNWPIIYIIWYIMTQLNQSIDHPSYQLSNQLINWSINQ